MSVTVSFDPDLSNKIFKANIKSLVDISKDNLGLIAAQNIEYFVDRFSGLEQNDTEWFEKGSHLTNVDWLLLNSIYISCYSFFEYHIHALAKSVEERSKSKIKLTDISDKGIIQSFNYLFLVGEITSADKPNLRWQELMLFQDLRNIIVHRGGVILKDLSTPLQKHKLFQFLTKHNVIMAGSLGHVRIRQTAILDAFLNLTFEISDSLSNEIIRKYPTS